MAKSSKRTSSRSQSIFDGIIPEAEGSDPSSKLSDFITNFYKPIAVVLAIIVLVWVSMYIYRGNENEKLKSTITDLKAAKSLEELRDPNLMAAVKGTELEYEWHLALMLKLMNNKDAGAKSIDYEGFIDEANIFIDKYPNKLATLQIMFNQATFYAYIGKIEEAKSVLKDIIAHPKADIDYSKIRAEKELAILNDPSADKEMNSDFIPGLAAFATERLATPTPSPTPVPTPSPVIPATPAPTNLDGATPPANTPAAKPGDATPAPPVTPKPLDINEPEPAKTSEPAKAPELPEPKDVTPEEPQKP